MDSMIGAFTEWLSFGPNIAAIVVIGMICDIIRRLVLGKRADRKEGDKPYTGWRAVYNTLYKAQAIVLGVLVGLIPGMPVPESFQSDGLGGAILNYAGDGAAAMIVYAALISNAKSYIDNLKKKANSTLGK